jgi:putative hydrolase of the HAD superfamily
VKGVLLDFGGVLAEEGFREGLQAVAREQGLDQFEVHRIALESIHDSGYVVGKAAESAFWDLLRARSGIRGEDADLRDLVLSRFIVRPAVLDAVRRIRKKGMVTAILSDQTDWLEKINRRYGFSSQFDRIFNSFELGMDKRDPRVFREVVTALGLAPSELLFVDDMPPNAERACSAGLQGVVFSGERSLIEILDEL